MAYFDPYVFGLLCMYPDVMIRNIILRSKMKFHEIDIVLGF